MDITSPKTSVQAIGPLALGRGRVKYAQGVKAGPWVFATGHMAQDPKTGFHSAVARSGLPHSGASRYAREAAHILDNLQEVLHSGACDFADLVRVDQYYTDPAAVVQYQKARRQRCKDYIPPSTSILVNGFSLPGASINIQAIGYAREPGETIETFDRGDIAAATTSGYKPAVRVGDYCFLAGATAVAQPGEDSRRGLATDAVPPDGLLWRGLPMKLETERILAKKLLPALQLAGSSLDNVVKAQVYIRGLENVGFFNEVWEEFFSASPPATTIVLCPNPGFAVADAHIEINVLALADGGATRKEILGTDLFTGFECQAPAVRAGNLLFLSGLMAVDRDGLVESARPSPGQKHYVSRAESQAEYILETADRLCRMAGTSLENVVRIQQFHTDISEFYPVHQEMRRWLPDTALPFSAVAVPELPVPGATLLVDFWVYAP